MEQVSSKATDPLQRNSVVEYQSQLVAGTRYCTSVYYDDLLYEVVGLIACTVVSQFEHPTVRLVGAHFIE